MRSRKFLCLFPTARSPERNGVRITDPLYSFELDGNWLEVPSGEPGLRTFRMADGSAQIAASGLRMELSKEQLEGFANKVVALRLKGERKVAARTGIEQLFIAELQIVRRPWGYALAYYGSDDRDRYFSFSGAVTANVAISIYGEALNGTRHAVSSVMDAIAASLQFDRTPCH